MKPGIESNLPENLDRQAQRFARALAAYNTAIECIMNARQLLWGDRGEIHPVQTDDVTMNAISLALKALEADRHHVERLADSAARIADEAATPNDRARRDKKATP